MPARDPYKQLAKRIDNLEKEVRSLSRARHRSTDPDGFLAASLADDTSRTSDFAQEAQSTTDTP